MEGRLVGALLIARADPTGFSYNELLLSDRISAQIAGVVAVKIRQKELASEQERRHAAEAENLELVGAARARSEFLTTVSHELLTPVTIIASLTSSLSRRVIKDDSSRFQELFDKVQSAKFNRSTQGRGRIVAGYFDFGVGRRSHLSDA
jgi:signal transduction histidine kinase